MYLPNIIAPLTTIVSALTSLTKTSQHFTPFSKSTSERLRNHQLNTAIEISGTMRITDNMIHQYSRHIDLVSMSMFCQVQISSTLTMSPLNARHQRRVRNIIDKRLAD